MRLRDIHFAKTLREMPGCHRRSSIGVDGKTIGVNTVGENYLPDEYCGERLYDTTLRARFYDTRGSAIALRKVAYGL